MSAIRYNEGKTRYDLVPTFAHEQLAKTLTVGADKYGDVNWRKGLSWSSMLGSLERHLVAIKKGEDYDPETGLLHSAHLMCNAAFLTEYYKIYPQGDDRIINKPLRIGVVVNSWIDDDKYGNPVDFPFRPHLYLAMNKPTDNMWDDEKSVYPTPTTTIVHGWKPDLDVPENIDVDVLVTVDPVLCEYLSQYTFTYLLDPTCSNRGHRHITSLEQII